MENYGYRKPTLGTYNRSVWDRIQIRLPLLRGCCHSPTEGLFHQTLLPREHPFHSPPHQTAAQSDGVWKIQPLPSVVGWDTSPWKRMGKNTADLYSWATRALHFRQKPCQGSERRPSVPGTEHVPHPSICTTWYSKGSGLLAILSFKQIPKDDETLLMETVSSVVLTDLQFHQLNSAYWGFTKL